MQQTDGYISNQTPRQAADSDTRHFSTASSIVNDPKQVAAFAVRAKKEATRVAAAKAKAEMRDKKAAEQEAKKSGKKQRKLRQAQEAEAEAQELKAKREVADEERRARLRREKDHEKQYREHRKQLESARREEQDRQCALKAVAWGFDPSAGLRGNAEPSVEPTGTFVIDGEHARGTTKASEEYSDVDGMGQRTGRRWHSGNTWGLEVGDAGKVVEQNYYHSKKAKRPEVSEK